MSVDNHTPIATSAAANAATFNAPLASLDAAIRKNNYAATAAPTVGDDTGDGYTVGSRWFDTTNDRSYVALDVTLGAAIWKEYANSLNGKMAVGAVNVTNAFQTVGITIDQGTNDDVALALQSTGDVSHGMTDVAGNSTYVTHAKLSGANGGLLLTSYSAATAALRLRGRAVTEDGSPRTTSSAAYINLDGQLKSGAGVGNVGSDKNLVTISGNGSVRFVFDSDGDSHQDVGTAWTNFDSHDDLALLNQLSAHVTRINDPLREGFGDWLNTNRDNLERLRLVSFNNDGHHFVNMSRLTMLLVGALRQLGARMEQLEQRLEQGLQRLEAAN